MPEKTIYNSFFYKNQEAGSYKSAEVVVPILINLIKPNSVIDVGCGLGTWLKVFMDNGILEILGIDGEYIDLKKLFIPKEKFITADLKTDFNIDRTFDLVISLEVGEHLPSMSADRFISNITRLGHIVYFSAAIPFQGGTDHINEQWQSFWARKFFERNFLAFDVIRNRIWENENVVPCYAQNGILYIHKDKIASLNNPIFDNNEVADINKLSIVHPKIYEALINPEQQTVRNQFNYFLKVLKNRISSRLKSK